MSAKKEEGDRYTNEYSRIRKLTSRYDIRTQSVSMLNSTIQIKLFNLNSLSY